MEELNVKPVKTGNLTVLVVLIIKLVPPVKMVTLWIAIVVRNVIVYVLPVKLLQVTVWFVLTP